MRPRLLTIPISHYCEKARWALDRATIGYTEEPHLQVIHVWKARRAGGGRTVPVLVTDEAIVDDSSAILEWADRDLPQERRLYPEGDAGARARDIESWLDERLGPDGRLWMYHGTLPVLDDMDEWALAGVPEWERRAFRTFGGVLDAAIRRHLGVDDARAAAALRSVDEVFDEIASRLADGRPYLTGERFTAADLTFAALSAAVLIPQDYGSPLPPLDALPAEMAEQVRRLRVHPAGAFAARIYAEQRR